MKKPFYNCILGANISITNMQEILNLILEQLEELKGEYVCFSNVHTTVMAYEDKEYRRVQNAAYVALPDGSPLSYVQRMRGHKEARRVAGPDFMAEMWKATQNKNVKHYFYGSTQDTIDSLKECLDKKYPGLQVVGMESPPFRPLTKEEDEEVIARINASGADVVWVGLGAPKQEKWMYEHRGKIHALMFGVGAGFDFHAGIAKRAPMWMQTHYLEWLYRLLQDPRRLWKRYVTTNLRFVYLLSRYALRGKNESGDKKLQSDKKHLLIYAHYYYPDVASTGQILTELAEGLKDDFDITVICTVPSYSGKIARKYRTHKYFYEMINGVYVLRVRVPEFRKNFAMSRIYNISQYFVSAMLATFKVGKVDYVYSISQPPVLGGLLGVYGKYVKRAKFIYNIQDFNPEQVMAVKYTKNRLVTNVMMALDKFSCKKADEVIFVGRDMERTLVKRFCKSREELDNYLKARQASQVANFDKPGVAKELANGRRHESGAECTAAKELAKALAARGLPKYTCINNWINEKEIYPLPADHEEVQALRREYGLAGKYVVMYSGNIGLYYDLLNLMKVIAHFRDNPDVVFLFVGGGSVREELEKYVSAKGLENVRFAPYQDKERLIYSLNLGDVHFVVNAKGIKGVSVPSKLYGVMAAGKPVLGILEKGTEARTIVEESGCGQSVDPGDYKAIEALIRHFIDTRNEESQKAMGLAGRAYLEKYLTKEISIEKYRKEIRSL